MKTRLHPMLLSLLAVAAFLAPPVQAGDKKAAVALTDKAHRSWILKEAKEGGKIISDRDFTFSELPKEVVGGTFLLRDSAQYKWWLAPQTLTASKPVTAYAIVRVKYLRKPAVSEVTLTKLTRDEGWTEVKAEVDTTFPSGEDWRWKIYKKPVKKGNINIQLRGLDWGTSNAVLFIFK